MQLTSDLNDLPLYSEYRSRFRQTAQAKQFDLFSQKIPGLTPFEKENSDGLSIDFATIQRNSPITLVHLSGVHGIEGYLGSDIQHHIMSSFSFTTLNYNFIFAHAVNPFGMAWYRRANENNVDLNRNGRSSFEPVSSESDFPLFQNYLDSQTPTQTMIRFLSAAMTAIQIGSHRTAQAISCGQYSFPNSLFFGGKSQQFELQVLFNTLQGLAPMTEKWYFIDVHTGLGGWKKELLILDPQATQTEYDFFSAALESPLTLPGKTKDIYAAHGMVSSLAKNQLKNVNYLIQEFGTVGFLKVIHSLILENANFLKKTSAPSLKYSKTMLNSFYPDNLNWRAYCCDQGQRRYIQILDQIRKERKLST